MLQSYLQISLILRESHLEQLKITIKYHKTHLSFGKGRELSPTLMSLMN